MRAYFHRNFDSAYQKLSRRIRAHCKERIHLFLTDEFHPLLGNHALRGTYSGCRSINITGDYRAIYRRIDSTSVLFITIGTHGQLYR